MAKPIEEIINELYSRPISSVSDPRAQRDTPEYDAVHKALDIQNGGTGEFFPLVARGGRIEVRRTCEGIYFAKSLNTGKEEEIPYTDLATLIPDLRDAVDEYGDSAPSFGNVRSLLPGTFDFDRKFSEKLAQGAYLPELLHEHLFGLMAGCGLEHVVSGAELNDIFQ